MTESAEDSTSGPEAWVDWQSSNSAYTPSAPTDPSPQPRRRSYRARRLRPPFPWVALFVGLLVGLAFIGLVVVLVVAALHSS